MNPEYIFFVVVGAVVLGSFLWRYIRSGSLAGALLDGKIRREVGELVLTSSATSSQSLKVHVMESSDGDAFVGLAIVSKAPLGASMVPVKLSKSQAQDLARLLQQAVE